MISNAERKHREKCFKAAVASFALEGVYIDPRAAVKAKDYIKGEMTIEELIQWYHNLCQQEQ